MQKRSEADLQTKHVAFEVKREPDDDGVIEGYASVFDVVDNGMDVVSRGAFKGSLATGRKIKMLWQHDPYDPIGVWDEVREDDRGLYVKGRISTDVQKGKDAIALFKMGAMDSLSIGYRTKNITRDGNGSIRRLEEIDLFEISVVTFPMLDNARASVKSIKTIREFEQALRDAGFSRTEAKAIAADGFKGLADHRDGVEVEADAEGWKALHSQIIKLQETFANV